MVNNDCYNRLSLGSGVTIAAVCLFLSLPCNAFLHQPSSPLFRHRIPSVAQRQNLPSPNHRIPTHLHLSAYTPPEDSTPPTLKKPTPPQPQIGDIIRYYDLDGGQIQGQELVGKIALIQPILSASATAPQEWLLEIYELDDVGDGFYAEYPYRERRNKKTLKNLKEVSPVRASFVRSQDAYRVPRTTDGRVLPSFDTYDITNYQGPAAVKIDESVVQSDAERYGILKGVLLKDAAIAGAIGAIGVNIVKGGEDAVIYAAGALAGVGYLYFLSVKTDTVGSPQAKFGNNISNIRFALPLFVLLGISLKNASVATTIAPFSTVTQEQFAAAMIGFLTYRVPLFLRQLQPVVEESAGSFLPGSAGIVAQMAKEATASSEERGSVLFKDELKTVLLVSGPAGTGKSSLVKKLLTDDPTRFVAPTLLDRFKDAIPLERFESRGDLLSLSPDGRYGLTKDAILSASQNGKVAVVDADVALAKSLTNVAGVRLIGVWVGLDSLEKFEERIGRQLEEGAITIPQDETKESVLRAKLRGVVKDIEYGVVSGIFEFTILNDDFEESFKQLKQAAEYCFR